MVDIDPRAAGRAAAAAAQARLTAAFRTSQLAQAEAAGVDAGVARRSVCGQVALARRESPISGGRHVGLATALVDEMPNTLRALDRGEISEWRATVIVRETACLARAHRAAVDLELAGRLSGWGDRRCAGEARAAAYRLDPRAVVDRLGRAANERRVSIRPAPDTMNYLTALLPVAQGVAAYAALRRCADDLRGVGDPRGRGQIMADELVARVTKAPGTSAGPAGGSAEPHPDPAALPRGTGVEIELIMTDTALFGTADEPATLAGHGPIPAEVARQFVRSADAGRVWIRRLYTDHTARLIGMDSRRRTFPASARRFIIIRDQTCRTPWCDAPIRHADHVQPAARGGPTEIANGQGLCENCNYTRAAPGWTGSVGADGRMHIGTPTGTRHTAEPRRHHPPRPVFDVVYPGRYVPAVGCCAA